jgi:hypothetical protein
MPLLLSKSLLGITILFCSDWVRAQDSCQALFNAPRTKLSLNRPQPLVDTSIRSADANDTQSARVSRDINFIKELFANNPFKGVPLIQYHDRRSGHHLSWFLSVSNNNRLFRVVIRETSQGTIHSAYADTPDPNVEKTYYRHVVQHLRIAPTRQSLFLPRRGQRELVVAPEVTVKLLLKHQLTMDEFLLALGRIPRSVQYRPNRDRRYQGKDSFLIFVDVGRRTPLEVVMLYDQDQYFLLTAFFPDVYR